jgi:glycerol-3-phosphate dehydrogenase
MRHPATQYPWFSQNSAQIRCAGDVRRRRARALNDLLNATPRKEPLHPDLPVRAGEVVWAVRYEAARTVDDVLARRTRSLLLNARAARQMAPRVAALMARELRRGPEWQKRQVEAFETISRNYLPDPPGAG